MPQRGVREFRMDRPCLLNHVEPFSREWLAGRLQMGASDSISSLLHRFRATGATERAEFKAILSGFRS